MRLLTSLALLVVLSHCSGNKVAPPHELPLEQISVSKGHFVFAESKLPFVPQGANWVRLSEADGRGKKKQKNISFDTEYFSANRAKIAASLNEMALLGFNVVRVRVDAAEIADYIKSLTDFIRMANERGIYVVISNQWLPKSYYKIAYNSKFPPPNPGASGINQLLMSEGTVQAYAKFEADLLRALAKQDPDVLSGIFAIDIWNELYFDSNSAPFSKTKGQFTTDGGKKFDLSKPKSRQALADDQTKRWTNAIAAAIKKAQPAILVTSSVFSPHEVQRKGYAGVYTKGSVWGDWRQPFRLKTLAQTKLDFLEVHSYPHPPNSGLESDLTSFEWPAIHSKKPVVIGEFGAYKADFKTITEATSGMTTFLKSACDQHVAGWLFWTWDTSEQPSLWNLQEGDLARALSPQKHPWCVSQTR